MSLNELHVIPNSGVILIDYDAQARRYTLSSSWGTVTLRRGDRTTPDGQWQNYEVDAGNVSDTVGIYSWPKAGTSNENALGQIQLSYLSLGKWFHEESDTGKHMDAYFLFGFPTAAADMPTSGAATYKTMFAANYVDFYERTQGDIDGTADFSIDFGTGKVATDLAMLNHTYSGSGAITAFSQFAGNFDTSSDPNFSGGGFDGGFYGPAAKEMGYTFWLNSVPEDPYAGASLRDIHYYHIIGVVAGTRN